MKVAAIVLGLTVSTWVLAQNPAVGPTLPDTTPSQPAVSPSRDTYTLAPPVPPALLLEDYRIGRGDVVEISVFQAPELTSTIRIPLSGIISLPRIGNFQASGVTENELAELIRQRLKGGYLNDPYVTVQIRQYASQPVSILGLVGSPGTKQLQGQKTLLDLIVMAGGLDPLAGTVQISRYDYSEDGTRSNGLSTININSDDLLQKGKTELNVPIYPGDIINVLKAGSVRVFGEVKVPTEIVMRSGRPLNVTQAIVASGGFSRSAKAGDTFILRYGLDGSRQEISIAADKIVKGTVEDIFLQADDILMVPSSKLKSGLNRVMDTTVSLGLQEAVRVILF